MTHEVTHEGVGPYRRAEHWVAGRDRRAVAAQHRSRLSLKRAMARIAEGDDTWAEGASCEHADVSPSSQVGPVDGGLSSGEFQAGRPEVHRGGERRARAPAAARERRGRRGGARSRRRRLAWSKCGCHPRKQQLRRGHRASTGWLGGAGAGQGRTLLSHRKPSAGVFDT